MQFTAEMIAGFLGGTVEGDRNAAVSEFAKIEEGRPGALSFLSNPKYEHHIYGSESSIVIVNDSFAPKKPVKATLVKVPDAYGAFAKLLELYAANKPRKGGISDKADVSPEASLGEGCYVGAFAVIESGVKVGSNVSIYPHAYIGDGVRLGDNVTVYSGATIYEGCVIGSNVTVHAGAVIGADGFGWAPGANGEYGKIPQIGNVVIEDNVDIGANTCIDRATMGSTIIKRGVKLDNLVQVGHNVVIGENTVAAALVGIAGTSKVGRSVMLGGQVGIAGHLNVGDRAQVGSKSGVSNDVPEGAAYFGYPAMPVTKHHRSHAVFRSLPDLSRTVGRLEKEIAKLKEEKENGEGK